MNSYTFNQHRHNYAVWTAARAVQRNFATTSKIKFAIEQSDLREFAKAQAITTTDEFNSHHLNWAEKIIKAFEDKGINTCTYGRAAKIIAIYLKTSVILCNQTNGTISSLIHPPIDGILLKEVSKLPGLEDLREVRWTQLTKEGYWDLVSRLNHYFKFFDWRLEYYWRPELDSTSSRVLGSLG